MLSSRCLRFVTVMSTDGKFEEAGNWRKPARSQPILCCGLFPITLDGGDHGDGGDPAMNILVGTAGFSYQDWQGIVYPPEVKKRQIHALQYLARFFDCCEINTSFYGHIRPDVGKDWCKKVAAVNRDFLLTAKLYQGFTHVPKGSQAPSPFRLTVPAKEEKLAREGLDSIANEGKLGA